MSASWRCAGCGFENAPGIKFCGECGRRLADSSPAQPEPRAYTPRHLAEKILVTRASLEGERKQVTVLFADMKGSMELAEQLDPEAWHGIMDRFFQLLAEGVHRFEGTVNQYTGDGIMALFGAPIAHEDHAQRACYAALHLRDVLRGYAQELRREHGLDLSVRMGLNSGEVVVGRIGDDLRMDYTAQGHVVGLAQRMEQLAEAGKPYLTEATAALVRGYVALEDLGTFTVKGVAAPLRVFALEGIGEHRTRFERSRARGLSRFVGREVEMTTLEAALTRALAGDGRVIGIVAEAGTGKSRLCHELAERCRARGILIRRAQGVAHGQAVPLLPVLEFYREIFGITPTDTAVEAQRKIAGSVVLLADELPEDLPLLFEFLGVPDPARPSPSMDPETRERRLLGLLKHLSTARSRREPALVIFEDLHWIDAATARVIEALVEATAGSRTLLVVNFRPGYRADWMEGAHYQPVALRPLDRAAIGELLGDWLGADPSLAGLVEQIQARTGGNPFFVEEVVQSLIESRTLEGRRGRYRLARPVETLDIPPTVQALLAARIDRLGDQEKGLLQAASVLGDEFDQALLARVVGLPAAELRADLGRLVGAELLYEQVLYPEPEYAFRHPLTREVAYGSQLAARRARLHAAVARALEDVEPEKLPERAALLAHHWEAAGELLIAARWRRRAAERAGLSSTRALLDHSQKLRELTDRLPPSPETDELGAIARGNLLMAGARLGGSPDEMAVLFREGETLARRLGSAELLARLLSAYGYYRLYTEGSSDEAVAEAEEAVRLADHSADVALQMMTRSALALVLSSRDHRAVLRVCDEGLARSEPDPERGTDGLGYPPWIAFASLKCLSLSALGRLAECPSLIEAMRDFASRRASSPSAALTLFLAHVAAAVYLTEIGDPERGLSEARHAVDVAERIVSNPVARQLAYSQLGHTAVHAGDSTTAIQALETALAIVREQHVGANREAREVANLALAKLARGDADHACALAAEALDIARRRQTPVTEPLAQLALARCLLRLHGAAAKPRVEAALVHAETAIEQTGMSLYRPRVLEVRADLARVLGDERAHAEHLRRAHRLYVAMGADGHAARLARELAL